MPRLLTASSLGFLALLAVVIWPWPVDVPVSQVWSARDAQAQGRPARRARRADVAREPSRRQIRRHEQEQPHHHRRHGGVTYYTALSGTCTDEDIGGYLYYRCDGVYYRAYYKGNSIVYVEETP